MINKKINIYCSNSYNIFIDEYPVIKNNLLDYDFDNKCPCGLKELVEKFMEMLNSDDEIIDVYTLSGHPLNIIGTLIGLNILNNELINVKFVGI